MCFGESGCIDLTAKWRILMLMELFAILISMSYWLYYCAKHCHWRYLNGSWDFSIIFATAKLLQLSQNKMFSWRKNILFHVPVTRFMFDCNILNIWKLEMLLIIYMHSQKSSYNDRVWNLGRCLECFRLIDIYLWVKN